MISFGSERKLETMKIPTLDSNDPKVREVLVDAFYLMFESSPQKGMARIPFTTKTGVGLVKVTFKLDGRSFMLLEQNPHTSSLYAEEAKIGHSIAWVMGQGSYIKDTNTHNSILIRRDKNSREITIHSGRS